jgi:hypothetical protein
MTVTFEGGGSAVILGLPDLSGASSAHPTLAVADPDRHYSQGEESWISRWCQARVNRFGVV